MNNHILHVEPMPDDWTKWEGTCSCGQSNYEPVDVLTATEALELLREQHDKHVQETQQCAQTHVLGY